VIIRDVFSIAKNAQMDISNKLKTATLRSSLKDKLGLKKVKLEAFVIVFRQKSFQKSKELKA